MHEETVVSLAAVGVEVEFTYFFLLDWLIHFKIMAILAVITLNNTQNVKNNIAYHYRNRGRYRPEFIPITGAQIRSQQKGPN